MPLSGSEHAPRAMGLLEDLPSVKGERGSALTIGVFDGVHLGHRHLIERLRTLAAEERLESNVITFLNHPRTVLVPRGPAHTYLTTQQERIDLLREAGVDRVLPLSFTREMSQLSYREFAQALVDRLRLRRLLIGPDFAMGRNREGTALTLTALGQQLGFSVSAAEPLIAEGQVVSTTAVRRFIESGDTLAAKRFLGRPHSLSGPVVHGEARGRTLGFPTANVDVPNEVLNPPDGIYCTLLWTQRTSWPSVTSIGTRPTFGSGQRTVETHILDFDGDLYGQTVKVELLQRLRDERKFDSVSALITQMNRDVAEARGVLSPFLGGRGA